MVRKNCDPKLYKVWEGMKRRCNAPQSKNYHRYGGRGVKVCEEWSDYEAFSAWAMANGYKHGLTLDRVENDKGYSPENCRWATMKEQQNNRGNNQKITIDGVEKTVCQWAEEYGINPHTIRGRIKRGWPEAKAVQKSSRKARRVVCIETGKVYASARSAFKETGIRHVHECADGERDSAGGLHWKWEE